MSRRAKVLGVIGLIVLAIGAVVALVLLVPRHGPQTTADVEALLERDPNEREAAHALKTNYPADYQRLLRHIVEVTRNRGQQAASRESAQFMARFLQSKVDAISAAPDRELQRIGGAQLAMMQILRDEDVRLCALYSVGDPQLGTRMPRSAMPVIARLSVYIIEAAHAGEQPGRTPRLALNDTDYEAWVAAMRTVDPVIARQIEADTVVRQPPETQCRAGVVVYEAARRLPGHVSANVTAYLVRESLTPTPTTAPAPAPPPVPVAR